MPLHVLRVELEGPGKGADGEGAEASAEEQLTNISQGHIRGTPVVDQTQKAVRASPNRIAG